MRDDVRRAALKAAAKVAISATFLGCGAKEENAGLAAGPLSGPDEGNATGAEAHTLARVLPGEREVSRMARTHGRCQCSDTRAQCCNAYVGEHFADGGPWENPPGTQYPPDLTSCCEDMLRNYPPPLTEDAGEPPPDYWQNIYMCCAVLDYPRGPACTPWGPPVPPSMDWRSEDDTGIANEGAMA